MKKVITKKKNLECFVILNEILTIQTIRVSYIIHIHHRFVKIYRLYICVIFVNKKKKENKKHHSREKILFLYQHLNNHVNLIMNLHMTCLPI